MKDNAIETLPGERKYLRKCIKEARRGNEGSWKELQEMIVDDRKVAMFVIRKPSVAGIKNSSGEALGTDAVINWVEAGNYAMSHESVGSIRTMINGRRRRLDYLAINGM